MRSDGRHHDYHVPRSSNGKAIYASDVPAALILELEIEPLQISRGPKFAGLFSPEDSPHSVPNGLYRYQFAGVSLAFFLVLFIWNTWSSFTLIATSVEHIFLNRVSLNSMLLLVSVVFICSMNSGSTRATTLLNLLCGIAVWELTECFIDFIFAGEVTKFIFNVSCLVFTSGVVFYLEYTGRVRVFDGGSMSGL